MFFFFNYVYVCFILFMYVKCIKKWFVNSCILESIEAITIHAAAYILQ